MSRHELSSDLTCVAPSPACIPTWICRWWRAAPLSAFIGDGGGPKAGLDMILDRFAIEGRVAIVTGAGLGIGRGIAIGLAEAGADVALAARTESDLEEVADHIRSLGRRALAVPTDVIDATACGHLVARTVEEFGRLDILVNNAGGAMPRAAMDTSEGFMSRTFAFNVIAPLTLTKLAARQIVDTVGQGAVVNISSRSASMTQSMFVAYGSAKAALDRMTRNIAPELAPRVRVNAIDVGGVATRSLEVVLTNDDLRQQFVGGTRCTDLVSLRTSPAPFCFSCRTPRRGSPARCSRLTAAPRHLRYGSRYPHLNPHVPMVPAIEQPVLRPRVAADTGELLNSLSFEIVEVARTPYPTSAHRVRARIRDQGHPLQE